MAEAIDSDPLIPRVPPRHPGVREGSSELLIEDTCHPIETYCPVKDAALNPPWPSLLGRYAHDL